MKKRPSRILCAILSFAFVIMTGAGHLTAQAPMLLGYDGYLLENKKPANGVRNMEVRLHDAASKGKLLYNEKVGKVSVSNGEFYFEYGSKLGEALKGGNYWMEVVVNGKAQSPRERLVAVPFALKSGDAQQAMQSVNALSGNLTKLGAQVLGASSNASAAVNALSGNVTTQVAMLEATIQALRDELEEAGVLDGGSGGGNATAEMVSVVGGTLPQGSKLAGEVVATFQIGKYEVTWGEWKTVRDWASSNGYSDLAEVGDTYPSGSVDNFPVINVSWYDVVKWSNARSEKEGLIPVYEMSGATYKTGEVAPTLNASANGYRLPSEKEWEWAARGGLSSGNFTYSGSNTVSEVAWTYENSSERTKAVGTKSANELGIYDMSGNVFEWCEDVAYTSGRRIRGGSWNYFVGNAAVAYRGGSDPDDRFYNIGFRVARSSGN